MGRFSVDLLLANRRDMILAQEGSLPPEKVRKVQCRGVVDPGATRLVLPETVVNQLGLPSAGEIQVRYADQRTVKRPRVEDVWLQLQNREGTFSASVEPDRTDALVGAFVLEELDFVVDCVTQTLHPRDPNTVWVFPMDGTTVWPRTSPDGKPAAYITRNAGKTWKRLDAGLPQNQAWLTVKRQAMAADTREPVGVYFGTTSGEVWGSRSEGERWTRLASHLPEIYAVEVAEF